MVQSRKSKKALSTGLMLAMVAMAISASNAATLTFTGGAGTGNFHDVENWDGKSVPTSSDQVIIKEGSTVSLSQAAKVRNKTIIIYTTKKMPFLYILFIK